MICLVVNHLETGIVIRSSTLNTIKVVDQRSHADMSAERIVLGDMSSSKSPRNPSRDRE